MWPHSSVFKSSSVPNIKCCVSIFFKTRLYNHKVLSSFSYVVYCLNDQGLAADIEPWLNKSEPDDMEWLQKKEKKLKELRSKLRHRLADLDDLREVGR